MDPSVKRPQPPSMLSSSTTPAEFKGRSAIPEFRLVRLCPRDARADIEAASPPGYGASCETRFWTPFDGADERDTLLLDQLLALHEHCFPVPYDNPFYRDLLAGQVPAAGSTPAHPTWRRRTRPYGHIVIVALAKTRVREADPVAGMSRSDGQRTTTATTDPAVSSPRESATPPLLVPHYPPLEGGAMLRTVPGKPVQTSGLHYAPAGPSPRETARRRSSEPAHRFPQEQVLGAILVRVRPLSPYACEEAEGDALDEGYVATLGTRDDCRGASIARRLLRAATAVAFSPPPSQASLREGGGRYRSSGGRGLCRLWLHCLQGNYAATMLYTSEHYDIADYLPGYYIIYGKQYDANILVRVNPGLGTTTRLSDAGSFAANPDYDQSPVAPAGVVVDDEPRLGPAASSAAFSLLQKGSPIDTEILSGRAKPPSQAAVFAAGLMFLAVGVAIFVIQQDARQKKRFTGVPAS